MKFDSGIITHKLVDVPPGEVYVCSTSFFNAIGVFFG